MFRASGPPSSHDCMPWNQTQAQDHKTHFETVLLPVAKILSPVARQVPTKPLWGHRPGLSLSGHLWTMCRWSPDNSWATWSGYASVSPWQTRLKGQWDASHCKVYLDPKEGSKWNLKSGGLEGPIFCWTTLFFKESNLTSLPQNKKASGKFGDASLCKQKITQTEARAMRWGCANRGFGGMSGRFSTGSQEISAISTK